MLKHAFRLCVLGALLPVLAGAAESATLSPASLQAWLQQYGAAWEARDPAAAGRLFSERAIYHEMPFDAPMQGRAAIEDYWRKVTAGQRDVKFEYRVIAVNGNTGVAHWSATFEQAADGAGAALDGVFVLEFDASGRCSALREWWHYKAG